MEAPKPAPKHPAQPMPTPHQAPPADSDMVVHPPQPNPIPDPVPDPPSD